LDTTILVVLLIALGFFAIPIFPISLELGVETTFPVAEATSSGILIIAGFGHCSLVFSD
jgi:FLVCR family MFS transporter 7